VRTHGDPGRLALAHRVVDEVTVEALLADPDRRPAPAASPNDEAR
jgi:hypothetical protein